MNESAQRTFEGYRVSVAGCGFTDSKCLPSLIGTVDEIQCDVLVIVARRG